MRQKRTEKNEKLKSETFYDMPLARSRLCYYFKTIFDTMRLSLRYTLALDYDTMELFLRTLESCIELYSNLSL